MKSRLVKTADDGYWFHTDIYDDKGEIIGSHRFKVDENNPYLEFGIIPSDGFYNIGNSKWFKQRMLK